ncbi:MAG: YceD family protein [Natronospirillum sp.]|uniref:YceD family protein n=1 Tax=Natronospirillum sp. TaxID=2812955 RepID=UPI0025EF9E3C|nr:YceD family protein [Natronospirillum sp.]MCH8551017.1 YceD family protein [Natronospirillum sp.]
MTNPQLPEFIAPYRLADREGVLEGAVRPHLLPRVSAAVLGLDAVQVEARFYRSDEGDRLVEGKVSAQVQMTCERCLGPMTQAMETRFVLMMVTEEAQLTSVPKKYEPWLVAPGEDIPLAELLEDTMLLALPPFPMHPEGECRIKTSFGDAETAETAASESPEKPNPFSVLANLKNGRKKQE